MVVRSPPLNSVKRGLLPSIHHPLPLSKQQSRQLLDTITTSFRKNLDKEHPWHPADNSTKAQSSAHSSPDSATQAPAPNTTSKPRPTDQHLRSILASPLFAQASHGSSSSSSNDAISKQLYIFDAAVAKDLMNYRRAAGFLVTVRNHLAETNESTYNLANTGAGFRVLQWLRTSNQEASMRFVSDTGLIMALIPFLFAEGLEEVAWEWLVRMAGPAFAHHQLEAGRTRASELPFSRLYAAIMRENKPKAEGSTSNLDLAYTAHLRAHQMLPRHRLASLNMNNNWRVLSWKSTMEAWKRSKPDTVLFENFVDSGRPLKLKVDLAHLDLHHPTSPDSDAALNLMHSGLPFIPGNLNPRVQDINQQRVICLALDAVDRLKQVGNTTEATWVEKFIISVFDLKNKHSRAMPLGRLAGWAAPA